MSSNQKKKQDKKPKALSRRQMLKEDLKHFQEKGDDLSQAVANDIRLQLAELDRQERLKKMAKEDPQMWKFFMSGPNINE